MAIEGPPRRSQVVVAVPVNLVIGALGTVPIFLWIFPVLWLAGDPEAGPATILWAVIPTLIYGAIVWVFNDSISRPMTTGSRARYWRVAWVVLGIMWIIEALLLFPPLRPPPF